MSKTKKLQIETILKILYKISKDDKFYFFSYGKDIINSYTEQENKELIETELNLVIEQRDLALKTINLLQNDANEADHADYCMCRFCSPDFHKLKTKKK